MDEHPPVRWLVLTASLTGRAASTVRVRLWRALKDLGVGNLRDGVSLLPATAETRAAFDALAHEVEAEGGTAWLLELPAQARPVDDALIGLFDRSADFAELFQTLTRLGAELPGWDEATARRELRQVEKALAEIQRVDFFPGVATERARAASVRWRPRSTAVSRPRGLPPVEAALQRGARVIRQRERGYAAALLEGIRESRAQFIVTMDADLSHRPAFLADLWKHRDRAELLIASRYVPGGESRTGRFRRLLSRILNVTYTRVLSLPLHDISSGFRMYRRDTLEGLTLRARDFDILEEMLIKIYTQGFRVVELPFRYLVRGSGRSHAHLFRFAWAYLKTLVRMWQLRNSEASSDYDHRAFDSPIPLQRYWQRHRHRIVLGFLDSCRSGRPGSILDVGCGSSRIIQDLPDAIGLDILFPKLRFLRGRHGHHAVCRRALPGLAAHHAARERARGVDQLARRVAEAQRVDALVLHDALEVALQLRPSTGLTHQRGDRLLRRSGDGGGAVSRSRTNHCNVRRSTSGTTA